MELSTLVGIALGVLGLVGLASTARNVANSSNAKSAIELLKEHVGALEDTVERLREEKEGLRNECVELRGRVSTLEGANKQLLDQIMSVPQFEALARVMSDNFSGVTAHLATIATTQERILRLITGGGTRHGDHGTDTDAGT